MLKRFRSFRIVFGLSIAAGFLSILLSEKRSLEELELKSRDFRLKWFQKSGECDTSIVVVLIDDEDLRRYGVGAADSSLWPLPRNVYARLIDTLYAMGAEVIGIDLVFLGGDRHRAGNDTSFARAIQRGGNVILPFTFACNSSSGDVRDILRFELRSNIVPAGYTGEKSITRVCVPPSMFCDAVPGMGFVGSIPDKDGVHRKIPLLIPYNEWLFLHFDVWVALQYLGLSYDSAAVHSGDIRFASGDMQNLLSISINEKAHMLISFRQANTLKQIKLREILDHCSTNMQDKIVLIGVSAPDLNVPECYPTPFDHAMPGVVYHACVINDILSRNILIETGMKTNLGLILIVCLLLGFILSFLFQIPQRDQSALTMRERSQFGAKSLLIFLILALTYSGIVICAFAFWGIFLHWTSLILTIVLAYMFTFSGLFVPQGLSLVSQKVAESFKKPDLSKFLYFVIKGIIITGFFLLGHWICNPPEEYGLYELLLYLTAIGVLNSGDLKEFIKKIK